MKGLAMEERATQKTELLEKTETELEKTRQNNEILRSRIDRAEVEYRTLKEKLDSQKSEMEELQKKFTTEFENIANKILKQNSEEFSAVTEKNMGDLLKPVREKFESFEKKVEDTYLKSKNDQVDLKAELKKMEKNTKNSLAIHPMKGKESNQTSWFSFPTKNILLSMPKFRWSPTNV